MKKLSYGFLLGLEIWGAILVLRKNGIFIPFVNNHLTDLMTIPMYAYLIGYIMNQVLGFHWKPDLTFVLTSVVYLSFLFEVVCPLLSNRFTGDIFDVLAYFAGGMGYYFYHKFIKRNRQYS